MTRTKVFAHSLLAVLTVLSLSNAYKASAFPVTVNRGPHGAISIVNSDNVPVDAKVAPTSPSHTFPTLMVRGSHGAPQLSLDSSDKMKTNGTISAVPQVLTRGPHGAAFIPN